MLLITYSSKLEELSRSDRSDRSETFGSKSATHTVGWLHCMGLGPARSEACGSALSRQHLPPTEQPGLSQAQWRVEASTGSYSSTVVVPLWCRCVPTRNTGTMAATGTNPHTATTGCSHTCQAILQVLSRATGTTQPAL